MEKFPIYAVSDDKKVDVLMVIIRMCNDQLFEIKRDEAGWLKVFIAFYGAVSYWMLSNFVVEVDPSLFLENESQYLRAVVIGAVVVSWVATIAFVYLFLRTRWSYYGVMRRMMRAKKALALGSEEVWGYPPEKVNYDMGTSVDVETWKKNTHVFSSFTTRLIYIFGGNVVVTMIGLSILPKFDSPGWVGLCFWIILIVALNIFLVIWAFVSDYFEFKGKEI